MFNTLAQRPDIETATARYEKMLGELRDRLSEQLGPMIWEPSSPMSRAGCSGFSAVKGTESRLLTTWVFRGAIPDDKWDKAVSIAVEVTKPYGFAQPGAMVNRPHDHKIIAFDEYGASYQLTTRVHTVLGLGTGCHLEAHAHPKKST
ncbi:LppA family lipoprotein [Allokutzneria oryzae]|uniref:LppA family lipoprotein n=1 Tax=Allokutzneria oryzae TaxID=1378989 RepID=A0ABV6A536_9PSEU